MKRRQLRLCSYRVAQTTIEARFAAGGEGMEVKRRGERRTVPTSLIFLIVLPLFPCNTRIRQTSAAK